MCINIRTSSNSELINTKVYTIHAVIELKYNALPTNFYWYKLYHMLLIYSYMLISHIIVYGDDLCVCNNGRTVDSLRGRGWSVVLCGEGG